MNRQWKRCVPQHKAVESSLDWWRKSTWTPRWCECSYLWWKRKRKNPHETMKVKWKWIDDTCWNSELTYTKLFIFWINWASNKQVLVLFGCGLTKCVITITVESYPLANIRRKKTSVSSLMFDLIEGTQWISIQTYTYTLEEVFLLPIMEFSRLFSHRISSSANDNSFIFYSLGASIVHSINFPLTSMLLLAFIFSIFSHW